MPRPPSIVFGATSINDPLGQPGLQPIGIGRALSNRASGLGDTIARWHESRRERICRRSGSGRSGGTYPVSFRRCRDRFSARPASQSVDAESVAKAIAQALAMPIEEGHARHQALLAVVSDYDVDRWQTAGAPDRSPGREWELARAAKLTSDSRFTVGKADKPLFESERRRRAWFARLTPVLGAGAIIMASANVVAVVQSKKARGRATDSSGLRSAETAKNHAINPAAIINAAPSR